MIVVLMSIIIILLVIINYYKLTFALCASLKTLPLSHYRRAPGSR